MKTAFKRGDKVWVANQIEGFPPRPGKVVNGNPKTGEVGEYVEVDFDGERLYCEKGDVTKRK